MSKMSDRAMNINNVRYVNSFAMVFSFIAVNMFIYRYNSEKSIKKFCLK